MFLYVGISRKTGELVAGELLLEVEVRGDEKTETFAVLDYDNMELHPVEACIKFPLPF